MPITSTIWNGGLIGPSGMLRNEFPESPAAVMGTPITRISASAARSGSPRASTTVTTITASAPAAGRGHGGEDADRRGEAEAEDDQERGRRAADAGIGAQGLCVLHALHPTPAPRGRGS